MGIWLLSSPALGLDNTNVYDTSHMRGSIRLSPQYAEKLWSGDSVRLIHPIIMGSLPFYKAGMLQISIW